MYVSARAFEKLRFAWQVTYDDDDNAAMHFTFLMILWMQSAFAEDRMACALHASPALLALLASWLLLT